MTPTLAIVVLVAFGWGSFFFALAETALFSLGQWRARQLAEHSPATGATVARLLAQPQDLLATIVLGNTFANAAMVATAWWGALRGVWPVGLTALLLLAVILVACEVVPKTLAVRSPEKWALRVAAPMAFLQTLTRPLRLLAQRLDGAILRAAVPKSMQPQAGLTEEDYKELLEMAFQHGSLAQSEKEILLQILSLDRRTAKDVLKPRAQMACISDDLSIEEMIEAARRFKHRRLPIYDETPDTIVGVLNTHTLLLDPHVDLADAIEFPSFVPESMNLLQLVKSLQRQQRGLAIVLDEFGGTAGLVTMEDILESLIGKIRRDDESKGFVMEKLAPGRWRLNGTMRLDDFRREHPDLRDVPDVETMGGLLVHLLGVVPEPGQSARFDGLKLVAQVADERRVRELVVEVVKG
jgi:CBS domain containing-hemolysin-like protein